MAATYSYKYSIHEVIRIHVVSMRYCHVVLAIVTHFKHEQLCFNWAL